jgi:hypothetical protein
MPVLRPAPYILQLLLLLLLLLFLQDTFLP